MTDDEAIDAVKRGERATTPHSICPLTLPGLCFGGHTGTRVIACNDVEDVIECSRCGEQWVARCTFNEDYA